MHIHGFGILDSEIQYTNTNPTTNQQISTALLSICLELHITTTNLHNQIKQLQNRILRKSNSKSPISTK